MNVETTPTFDNLSARILDSLGHAVVWMDLDGCITGWNHGAEVLFGWPSALALGTPLSVQVSAPLLDVRAPTLAAALQAGRTWSGAHQAMRPDGRMVTVASRILPVRGDDGALVAIVCESEDAAGDSRHRQALDLWERCRVALEHSAVIIFNQDIDLRYTWIHNPRLGYTPEDVIGKTDADLFVPESAELLTSIKRRVLETGVGVRQEVFVATTGHPAIRRDAHIDLTVEPLRLDSGEVIGITSASVDITERKEMEERVRLQALLLESVKHALFAVDRQGKIIYWNQEAERLYGRPAADALGKNGVSVIAVTEDERNLARRILSKVYREKRAWSDEHVAQQPDGSSTPVWSSVMPVQDATGDVIAVIGLSVDIADRKKAEAERERLLGQLEHERTRLRTIIDRAPVGIIFAEGASGERLLVNPRAKEIFGRRPAQDSGVRQNVGWVCRPDGSILADHEIPAARTLRGESLSGEEFLIRRPDGTSVPVLVFTSPVRDCKGAISGCIAMFEDMTSLKDLERLRQEWAAVVSHDLRQPLGVIAMNASALEVLVEQQASKEATEVEAVRHIRTSAEHLSRLVSDLLDVSRIESRRVELRREPTRLADLLQAVTHRFASTLADRPILLDVPESFPEVSLDPVRIEQVLNNLLSNAAKYGAPGTEIRLAVSPGDRAVRIAVTNHGDGIGANDLPQLFSRFRRTRAARDGSLPGLGLGLYICKGLVEAHGGEIGVESIPGQTTTFWFTLPLAAG